MAMQQGGRTQLDGSAGATGAASGVAALGSAPLSEEQAESYAASYRPAWDIEYDATSLDPAQVSSQALSEKTRNAPPVPVRVELNPKTGKTLILGSPAIPPPADSVDDAAKTLEMPADRAVKLAASLPSREARAKVTSAVSTEELDAFVAQRAPKRGPLFIALGLGVVIGGVVLMKLLPSGDAPAPETQATTKAPSTSAAPPPTAKTEREEVPPPSAAAHVDDPVTAPEPESNTTKTTATAPVTASPAGPVSAANASGAALNTSSPKAALPPLPPAKETKPKEEPKAKAAPPLPPPKTAAPAPSPKTPPKGPGSGIVRDSPF